jgi:acetylornithine deacetylase/succinyl-diaminopimelate desuccinylase-like protein
VIVVADTANLETGTPCLTTSLRGLVDCVVEVRTLDNAIHSGLAGGVAPDALTAMSKLLATLHDEQGRVAVPGLVRRDAGTLKLQDWWRESFGVVEGVELIGDGTIESRIWMQPAIAILAIDAPPVADAINQLVPSARAKVSMRVAPGQDPKDAMAALVTYLEANAPWGARVTVTPGALGESFELDATGPAYEAFRSALSEAWGRDPIDIGIGGSIPFVAAFSSQFPMAAIVLFGVADNQSKPHAPDESVDLDELRRGAFAEAVVLRLLAG